MKCKLCNSNAKLISKNLTYLGKHKADMFQCENCELLQIDPVNWLEEAYSDSIAITDTGLVARNVMLVKRVVVLLSVLNVKIMVPIFFLRVFKKFLFSFLIMKMTPYKKNILDFGGGYGLLVRMLRDVGLNAFWNDLYTNNLLARGFEKTSIHYETILSFEVMEHLENPKLEFDKIFLEYKPEILLTSTMNYGESIPSQDWWYYSFETGQHITFYNSKTFDLIARTYGYHYFSIDPTFHIFTKQKLNENLIRFFVERADFFFPNISGKYNSLTWADHEKMVNSIRHS